MKMPSIAVLARAINTSCLLNKRGQHLIETTPSSCSCIQHVSARALQGWLWSRSAVCGPTLVCESHRGADRALPSVQCAEEELGHQNGRCHRHRSRVSRVAAAVRTQAGRSCSTAPALLRSRVPRRGSVSDYQASVGGGGPLAALILGIGFYSALGSDQRCCCCTGSSASCSECVPRKFEQTLRGRGVPAAVAAHLADVVLTDVMGRSVHVSGADNAARVQRLQDHQRTLYHQTDPAAAAAIVASQRFLRGSSGLAGGGIYFAESPKETMHKAHNHGTILKATVLLGRQLSINPDGDRSINFQSLLQAGYDSVLIPRPGGTEHVVYNYDQVKDIRQA
jgi:hypothetical protein